MEEVDKIIMHQLHQLDATIEPTERLDRFTPELVVRAVSSCLHEIKPLAQLPRSLPPVMAQRFSVATTLAEACKDNGYHGDIGYQTFLYPNAIELRRLLMSLIEQLPREQEHGDDQLSKSPLSAREQLEREIRKKLTAQLKTPWVPQFCRTVGNRRPQGCSSQCIEFEPQLNLNIPGPDAQNRTKELQQYFDQLAPNVFQQTAPLCFDLIASVMHKNDLDRWGYVVPESVMHLIQATEDSSNDSSLLPPPTQTQTSESQPPTVEQTPLDILNDSVKELRDKCEALLAKRKALSVDLASLKSREAQAGVQLEQLRPNLKLHERLCMVIEDPTENLPKLEGLLSTTKVKRETLTNQWQDYRRPLLATLEELKTAKDAQFVQNVLALRLSKEQVEQELSAKTQKHNELSAALRNAPQTIAPRKEYTRRIHEFIGNIRKQRDDIFKVLEDTRQLQKQLNVVDAQLQRQFNYTDDLLFQSAKHDLHAKKAYKLLAQLHINCNELVECISLTGNVTKEIRELEVQIDSEKLKNVVTSLHQITGDIRKFEQHIQDLQSEIRTVENEITAA